MLIGVAIVLGLLLVGVFFDSWLEKLLGTLKLDRRQIQTLRAVARVSLQVLSVLFALLVILGPPGQLTTYLGLATAGLTVALKDFIVGFIGWLVLMGKNGIRLGDWVEINGVTGEVVETGMFHTVLLETGNWTDRCQSTRESTNQTGKETALERRGRRRRGRRERSPRAPKSSNS